MKNTLKKPSYHDFWILSHKEQDRFRNYHLPIFECPSCGSIKNSAWDVNILGNACVNCGDTETLQEFEKSSFKQFQKWEFAFELKMSEIEHQKIIKHFQSYILWQCDHCRRQNFNLPKNSNGGPDLDANISCQWCPSPYNPKEDFLSFWAMKDFGFDDGDDSSNEYELKKLAEGQFLWLKAVAKARKIDSEKWPSHNEELLQLQKSLEKRKQASRSIAWGRMKDGERLIEFLEEYLQGEAITKRQKIQRRTRDYIHEIVAANSTRMTTPYQKDTGIVWKYFFNLTRFEQATVIWTAAWSVAALITALAILEKTAQIDIQDVSHRVTLLREDKWTFELEYSTQRREPYYDEDASDDDDEKYSYKTIPDTQWKDAYEGYLAQRDLYRLQYLNELTERQNGSIDVDTGKDKWINVDCPDESDDDTTSIPLTPRSSGGWTTYSPPSGWSQGFKYDGNGWLFHHPEPEEFFSEGYIDISSLGTEILQVSSEVVSTILWVSPAYAHGHNCGYYVDIEIENVPRYKTSQKYSVWDWKDIQTFKSDITQWIDYTRSLDILRNTSITDTVNQREKWDKVERFVDISYRERLSRIPVSNQSDWVNLSEHTWEVCSITISYLNWILHWIDSKSIVEQCLQ